MGQGCVLEDSPVRSFVVLGHQWPDPGDDDCDRLGVADLDLDIGSCEQLAGHTNLVDIETAGRIGGRVTGHEADGVDVVGEPWMAVNVPQHEPAVDDQLPRGGSGPDSGQWHG